MLYTPSTIFSIAQHVISYDFTNSGEKLSKKVTQAATNQSRTTYYIGDFVYSESELQFILHEEGRVKVITAINDNNREVNDGANGCTLPGGKQGVFEYFLKDHLGSTRMVLTEEVQKEFNTATMDGANASSEEQFFGKVTIDPTTGNVTIPADNELRRARTNNLQSGAGWEGNNTDFVKLTAAEGKSIGPNMILKVMAGDVISTKARYFYKQNSSYGEGTPVTSMVNSLINALLGNSGSMLGKASSSEVSSYLNGNYEFNNFINSVQPGTGNTSAPKAYLNVVFLDEQFKFIDKDVATPGTGTDFQRVSLVNNAIAGFALMQQRAPKNGWAFVYLSNESNESVFFDDFYVSQEHGRISEETHYYPHGLKIAGISSKAFNKLENKYGYQGDYSEAEEESGWDEFFLRNYDPQIGRWIGVDPYDEFASPYIGMGNDPINLIDPDGGESNVWLFNRSTEQWQWFDEIKDYKGYLASGLSNNYDYIFENAMGGFVADFAGKSYLYLAGGNISEVGSLPEVVIHAGKSLNLKPGEKIIKDAVVINPQKCHISWDEINKNVKERYKNLDWEHGQVDFPRPKWADWTLNNFSPRTGVKDMDFNGLNVPTQVFIDHNGYLTDRQVPFASTIPVGGMRGMPNSGGLTNRQLVQRAATYAEDYVGGTGGVAGTLKHQAATRYINLYQRFNGNRGLRTNEFFNNGVGNRGFLDVLDQRNGIIYDFKFGKAVMSSSQRAKYTRNFGLPIQIIRP